MHLLVAHPNQQEEDERGEPPKRQRRGQALLGSSLAQARKGDLVVGW